MDRSPCVTKDSSDAPKGLSLKASPFPNISEVKESRPSETCQHEQTDEGPLTSIEMILGMRKSHSSDASKGLSMKAPPFPNISEVKESRPSETCQHEQTDEGPFTSIEMNLGNFKMHNVAEGMNDKNPTKNNKNKSHSLEEFHGCCMKCSFLIFHNNPICTVCPGCKKKNEAW